MQYKVDLLKDYLSTIGGNAVSVAQEFDKAVQVMKNEMKIKEQNENRIEIEDVMNRIEIMDKKIDKIMDNLIVLKESIERIEELEKSKSIGWAF